MTDTTANAIVPGAIKESFRSSWELDRLEVLDGGADDAANIRQHAVRRPGHFSSRRA